MIANASRTSFSPRRSLACAGLALAWAGYTQGAMGATAPFVARELGLTDSQIAQAFAVVALAALGVFVLSHLADHVGRRRVLLSAAFALPVGAGATMLARSLNEFVAAQLLAQTSAGTAMAIAAVIIAEELDTEKRAAGEAIGGVAYTLGAGAAMLVAGITGERLGSFRFTWIAPLMSMLTIPILMIWLPETQRWATTPRRSARIWDVLRSRYRRGALGLSAFVLLYSIASTAVGAWVFYHVVRTLRQPPLLGTIVLIGGGAVGLAGFSAGKLLADRIGRIPTAIICALGSTIAGIAYYRVGGESLAVLLFSAFAVMSALGNATLVALRTLGNELFPTRLRGTISGWAAVLSATGAVIAHAITSVAVQKGGDLSSAVALIAIGIIPGAFLLPAFVAETKGKDLSTLDENDAREAA